MISRRRLLSLTSAAAVATIAAVSQMSSAEATDKVVKFQLAWLPNAAAAGEIVALEKGFFKDKGLDVEILPGGPSTNTVQETLAGVATIAHAYAPQIMYAADKGLPIKSFGASFQVAPLTFYSLGETGVESVADWKGKRIGASQTGLPQVKALLDHSGLSIDDITFVQAQIPALMQGQVDVVASWPTNLATLEPITSHPGGYNTQSIWDNGLQFQSNYYIATTETIENDSATLAAFLEAVDMGWSYVADHPEEAIEIVTATAEGLRPEAEMAALKVTLDGGYIYNEDTVEHGFANVDKDRWQRTLDLYAKIGEIGELKTDDVFDSSILDQTELTKR